MKLGIKEIEYSTGVTYYKVVRKFLWFWIDYRYPVLHISRSLYNRDTLENKSLPGDLEFCKKVLNHFRIGNMKYRGHKLSPVLVEGDFLYEKVRYKLLYYIPDFNKYTAGCDFKSTKYGTLEECKKIIDKKYPPKITKTTRIIYGE